MIRTGSIALAIALFAGATPAFAAENLDCVASGYGAEGDAAIEAYAAGFSLDTLDEKGLPADVQAVVDARANDCAEENGWSDGAKATAFLYATALIGEKGARTFSPEASAIVDRIDVELEPKVRDRLWDIVGKISGQALAGEENTMPGQEDLIFLGATMMMLDPDGGAESGQHVGALLGMISIRRNAANVFEAF